jgi:hypothetical protein
MESGLFDSEGKEVKCKCGNSAIGFVSGTKAFMCWCKECDPNIEFGDDEPKTLIFGKPSKTEVEWAPEWIIDLDKIKEEL